MELLALGLFFFPNVAGATESEEPDYYMTLFAYQGRPNVPRRAHTFATFVRVQGGKAEVHTISWLPKSLNVNVLRRASEPGANLDLARTLEVAAAQNAQVARWGPFRIKKELFDKALQQIERLDAGKVGYIAMDDGLRPDRATNCIHAISDLRNDGGLLNTGLTYGNAATGLVVEHLRPWLVGETTHPEIDEHMGLDKYSWMQK